MNFCKTLLGAAILVAGFALPARADLTFEIGSTTMLAGGAGTVDVMITGENLLAGVSMDFTITSADPGLVSFVQLPSREPFTDSPNYVFSGDSSVVTNNITFFGAPDLGGSAINGGDSTESGNNVTLNPLTSKLMATLYLTASPSAMAGRTATISLDPTSSFGYYDNESNLVYYNFSSSSGIVTIATAVPEPSSLALVLAGILGSAATRFGVNRRRKTRTENDNPVLPTEAI
jgi:hypothetical protein